MKKIIPYLLAGMAVVAGCNKMSESVSDPKAGLNGGFEQSSDGLPLNWLVYTQQTTGNPDFDVFLDTLDFREGKQSVCFVVRTCSSKGGRFSPGIAQEIPVKAGDEYRIRYRIKNAGCMFSVKVSGVNAFDASAEYVLPCVPGTKEWQQAEATYRIPAKMERLRFEVSVTGPGTLHIDGVEITKIP